MIAPRKPYSLRILIAGRWIVTAESYDPTEIKAKARTSISYSPSTTVERVEIHDLTGCLETVWDRGWLKS